MLHLFEVQTYATPTIEASNMHKMKLLRIDHLHMEDTIMKVKQSELTVFGYMSRARKYLSLHSTTGNLFIKDVKKLMAPI